MTRVAEPVMHANENRVDVVYEIFVKNKATGEVSEIHETHAMRYFFPPELELAAELTGLRLLDRKTFMDDARNPGFDTWNVVFLATPEP